MEVDKKQLGKKIRAIRLSKGLNQSEFAYEIGATLPAVSSWETGKHKPGPFTLKKIADLAGTSMGELLEVYCHRKKVGLYWISDCGKKLFADPLGFNEFKNFTYCPYCGKKLAREEVDND